MKLKGIFSGRPAPFQLFLLFTFILAGALLTATIGLLAGQGKGMSPDAGWLRLFQLISSVFLFLLPALLVAYLCSAHPPEYLSAKVVPRPKILFLTFVSMFLLSPTITLTGVLNQAVKLPALLEPVERWLRSMEASAEQVTKFLLADADWFSLSMNLLVIAVAAAVTEEFLFRGTLQRIIGKWTSNPHTVIWLTAVIFSAVHMQFYGFIPRVLLGAYFGYLLYWSRSIWVPVFAHFTNNAVAVIGLSNENLKDNVFISGDVPASEITRFLIPAALTLFLFFFCIKRLRKELTRSS